MELGRFWRDKSMTQSRFKKTVLWEGSSGLYFLCRVLNIGSSTDELKIIVTEPEAPTGAMYTEGKGRFTGTELVRLQAELSYHSDGSLLQKMPSYSPRTSTEYRNPSGMGARRLPLDQIRAWEPFARYTVIRPTPYGRPPDPDVLVARDTTVLDGSPFACTFSLGPTSLPDPADEAGVARLRIAAVASEIDLLLEFRASSYHGKVMQLPNTGKPIFMANNVLEIVERRTVWHSTVTTTWR
jgi:hypothetical protein